MSDLIGQLAIRAATIDELMSDDFEVLTGQKDDTDVATRRLAAWCRAAASGDWALFGRRLERDGLSLVEVLTRLATVRRKPGASPPGWLADAEWVVAAFEAEAAETASGPREGEEPIAFEHLFAAVADGAEQRLREKFTAQAIGNFTEAGLRSLRRALVAQLGELCAAALYERFKTGTPNYRHFVDDMRGGGWRRLFEGKPVLLRLIAVLVRQWIETTAELIERLDADLPALRSGLLGAASGGKIVEVTGSLSDLHNDGHSVQILTFENSVRLVYKPKDMRLDAAWQAMVARLNQASPPVELRPMRVLARAGYGWTEFIGHGGCAGRSGVDLFFRRAGAWLALFHTFASTDMHGENMIADGDHPVPIDLEMILQATAPEAESPLPERQAFDRAARRISESVMTTGLLPSYGRSPENKVYGQGGLLASGGSRRTWTWDNVNSDAMRRISRLQAVEPLTNLPHVDGEQVGLGEHRQALLEGYEAYGAFLLRLRGTPDGGHLFDGFAGLPVRKVVRPTRFYYLLTQRLRDHRTMDDGVLWSAQADFCARLADWNRADDPLWPLQVAERAALVALNVPHFVSPTDDDRIASAKGVMVRTGATPGLARAQARFERADEADLAWQGEIVRQSTATVSGAGASLQARTMRLPEIHAPLDKAALLAEAGVVFAHLSASAIRSGPGAAWLGLDWLGDSEVSQLSPLGYDLYNGSLGIALFLAAHAKVTGNAQARDLALAAIASLRTELHEPAAARMARALGTGGAAGLGSIVYGLTTVAHFLGEAAVLADAQAAAGLFSKDLIAADKGLDIISGSAGAIMGLLRLYRATGGADVLARAVQCGDHLLAQRKAGTGDLKCWVGEGFDGRPLNGMSHGAAGFAYALAALAEASGLARFAHAARDCLAFENASFSDARANWPDLRSQPEPGWTCQWCHGALGIGLARLGMLRDARGDDASLLRTDVERALSCTKGAWPQTVDTLCCGTLGTVEFLDQAGRSLGLGELRDLASQRLAAIVAGAASNGDYGFAGNSRQFTLGLFRGMAGVGYTLLRRIDEQLPNILLWE